MDDVLKTLIAEGAGEGEEGMYAIGSVIMNRSQRRGKTPQQIVNEPKQFTGRFRKDLDRFVASQSSETIAAAQRAWQKAQQNPIADVDHYMTTQLYKSPKRPNWAASMGGVQQIGRHTFMSSRKKPIQQSTGGPQMPNNMMNDVLYQVDKGLRQRGHPPMDAATLKEVYARMEHPEVKQAIQSGQLTAEKIIQEVESAIKGMKNPGPQPMQQAQAPQQPMPMVQGASR